MARNLIGTGADQISLNGMLGELAFQSKENINFTGGTGKLSKLDIEAISYQIEAAAVDVFVYDTSKDSDGGAWRKRCQHTSWYNETLNTSTRGSRKEFPSVAVIVATTNTVTIYDADDATMPMWMVFNVSNSTWLKLYLNSAQCKCVSALNGKFAAGGGGQGFRLSVVDFISDSGYVSEPSYNYIHQDISRRNIDPVGPATGSIFVGSGYINDVAMTVLPNAPIDAATGLQVPTIAVATSAGVSVIRDNGTVNSYAPDVASNYVALRSNPAEVIFGWGDAYVTFPIGTPSGTINYTYGNDRHYNGNKSTGYYPYFRSAASLITAMDQYEFAIHDAGWLHLYSEDPSGRRSLDALIASKHNTGWMIGDTKGAWLSDTTTEVVTQTELVTNGNMSSSTGWTIGAGISIAGGVAVFSSPAHGTNLNQTSPQFIIGKTYAIKFDVTAFTSGRVTIYANYSTGSTQLVAVSVGGGVGSYYYTWTASTTGTGFTIQADSVSSGACNLTIDNVSITPAEADRSWNTKGLQVYGSITKTPVAAEADLVAYSGFSTSNYLQQPYNSTLDFGTGDFCITGWARRSSTSLQAIFERGTSGVSAGDNSFAAAFSGDGTLYFQTHATAVDFLRTANSGNPSPLNSWVHFTMIRTAYGIRIYQNGVLLGSALGAAKNVSNTNAVLVVGKTTANTIPFSGDLALLRISATIPTEDQIRKMYNDEKQLFQDNAKATLYGTSDAVTGLAYDQDTQLLHVGTSSGRSVFQGLRRIDNTTTAVTASISAANGLVAEQ